MEEAKESVNKWQVWIYKKEKIYNKGQLFDDLKKAFEVIKANNDPTYEYIFKTIHVVKDEKGKWKPPTD